ncbi:C1 family peptidase [Flavobacterium oreochromis]|uniref:C1 family peptidase n=1 Tax=Flavobacterium oreochromis TaxID=2906078 RepID=UPI0038595895
MENPFFLKIFTNSISVLASTFLFVSCQTEKLDRNEKNEELAKKEEFRKLGVPEFSESYLKSIDPLTPAEYKQHVRNLRPDLSSQQMREALTETLPSSFVLPAMPIGDQGTEGSCVSFGIGYAAHSITRYINNPIHNKDWKGAIRSAAFVYNQIKLSDCASGSMPDDAMNLLQSKGECSQQQMPYVEGSCYTQPNFKQFQYASERKISGWKNITATNVDDLKYYLSKNYPIPACFNYNASFQAISQNNFVWDKVYGKRTGGHCVCIVGYDDLTKQFKVQNSWGNTWGKSGYFYVTYDAIKQGAFVWAAIMFPNLKQDTPQGI